MSSILYMPIIKSIAARGSPTDWNIMFKLKIPAIGTEGVLNVFRRIMNDMIKSEDVVRSIPWHCAAKRTPVPKMIAAPFWERDVPSGIVNEEMSRDTPISSNVSICRGIVALDDAEENAKSITGTYFLRNLKGFNLVKTKIIIGYAINEFKS